MRIQRLATTQFRNLVHDPIEFSGGVNLFIGENGHGKTNVLEAIFSFKFGRSFRTTRDVELVRFGEPFCRVDASAHFEAGGDERFEMSIERTGTKTIKHDGKVVSRYAELVGRYPAVLFGPHDLDVVSGYPAERRRFLDMVGSMTDRAYLDDLKAYRRVLKQRNAALKARRLNEAQGVWTEELIRCGCSVLERRQALTEEIAGQVAAHADTLGVTYPVTLAYESELATGRPEEVGCEEHFAAKLAAAEQEEMQRGSTLIGPHRDELRLMTGGRDLRRYGSQGQRRLAAILLRLAELSHLEARLRERCVLLLDDVFSELDDEVTAKLKRMLDGGHQIFVTSPVPLKWAGDVEAKAFRVADGVVNETQSTP